MTQPIEFCILDHIVNRHQNSVAISNKEEERILYLKNGEVIVVCAGIRNSPLKREHCHGRNVTSYHSFSLLWQFCEPAPKLCCNFHKWILDSLLDFFNLCRNKEEKMCISLEWINLYSYFFYNSAENCCLITDQIKNCNIGLTRLCLYLYPSSDLETGGRIPDFCDNCE